MTMCSCTDNKNLWACLPILWDWLVNVKLTFTRDRDNFAKLQMTIEVNMVPG